MRFHKIEYVYKVFDDMKKPELSEILQLFLLEAAGFAPQTGWRNLAMPLRRELVEAPDHY